MTTAAAQHYLQNSLLQKDHAADLVSMLNVPRGGLVLDLGCGTGHLATILSDLVGPDGKVVAVDPDAERIKIAKNENSRPNIQYSVANDQTFPGKGYDLIVSTHVIHWIEDKETLFNRIYSKLAPGGNFGFITYDGKIKLPPLFSNGLSLLASPNFEPNLLGRMYYEKKDAYQQFTAAVGLKILQSKVTPKVLMHTSVDDFLEFWSGVSHGSFSISDVDGKKLKSFREKHEKELVCEQMKLDALFIVANKTQ